MKLVSFSLYGDDPKYLDGILRNADFIRTSMPTWTMRAYCGNEVPVDLNNALRAQGCEVFVQDTTWHRNGMFWRYMPLGEEGLQHIAFRDADSRMGPRDIVALQHWIASEFPAHIIRDHPFHQTPILGGLWGIDNSKVRMESFWNIAHRYDKNFGEDQRFLAKYVYPEIHKHALIHDAYFCFEGRNKTQIDQIRTLEFMGESYMEDESTDTNLRNVIQDFQNKRKFRTRVRCGSFLQSKLLLSKSYFVSQRALTIPKGKL